MKAGRVLLTSVAVLTAAGGFIADMNKTHMFNPAWTPHSKFHDAMTILMAFMLGSAGAVVLQKKGSAKDERVLLATLLPASFWLAMAGSFAFPGAKGLEAEFPDKVKRAGPVKLNEGFGSAVMLSLLAIGYFLEKKNK